MKWLNTCFSVAAIGLTLGSPAVAIAVTEKSAPSASDLGARTPTYWPFKTPEPSVAARHLATGCVTYGHGDYSAQISRPTSDHDLRLVEIAESIGGANNLSIGPDGIDGDGFGLYVPDNSVLPSWSYGLGSTGVITSTANAVAYDIEEIVKKQRSGETNSLDEVVKGDTFSYTASVSNDTSVGFGRQGLTVDVVCLYLTWTQYIAHEEPSAVLDDPYGRLANGLPTSPQPDGYTNSISASRVVIFDRSGQHILAVIDPSFQTNFFQMKGNPEAPAPQDAPARLWLINTL